MIRCGSTPLTIKCAARDAMDLRLAGPRPGDNGKWSAAERAAVRNTIGHRAPLAAVEIVEVLARHGRTFESSTMTDSVEPIVPLHEADGTEYLRSWETLRVLDFDRRTVANAYARPRIFAWKRSRKFEWLKCRGQSRRAVEVAAAAGEIRF